MSDRKQQQNAVLLPSGFVDSLPPEAGVETDAVSALLSRFRAFGYERVKPPLLEFEESLFASGPGAALAHESFRLMDPVSHKMMALRPDITAQVSRIARARLKHEARPLRLTYAGDVLRTKASQQRTARQFCQVGCELIGDESAEAEIESCMLALLGLLDLGVEGITLDLCFPEMVRRFLGDDMAAAEALAQRNFDSLSQSQRDGLQALEDDVKAHIHDVRVGVEKALDDLALSAHVRVSVDPFETQGFDYQTGVSFTLFARGVSGELGRGGRYILQDGESGVGFTLYMDTVRSVMTPLAPRDIKYVPKAQSWAEIKRLQSEGFVVIRSDEKVVET